MDYSRLVKAYDIRGEVPEQLNTDVARKAGALFIRLTDAPRIVVARDMRSTSPDLANAFADGATSAGADVVLAGLGSTDYLYYASGTLNVPGAMITASHNPAKDNGIKLCRAGAAPVGEDSGLAQIRHWLETDDIPAPASSPGLILRSNLLGDYAAHLKKLVDLTGIRRLKVVADAGNGMAGHTVPAVLAGLPIDLVAMYFELDGTFPNHEANPLEPKNLVDLQNKVRETGADIGLAFDGDADRCFFVDERGHAVPPSAIVGLVATRELAKHPGSAIVHNAITSAAAVEIIRENGGTPVRSRVGHSFMKALMAKHGAVFGGEHSGHYYFRDFWNADTGMLAALHVLAALGEQDLPLSELVASYTRYAASGEVNSEVADVPAKLTEIENVYQQLDDVTTDRLDGLTVTLGAGRWFNLRPSNTEPLLRLNVEAPTDDAVETLRDEVLALVRA
ncbi:phosphomannomutase/phosphoglucomutase [Streptomyces roseoverticillatus]|uniref:phosphomannomutase/phosphoglucomutase n=1 Tax=Streptomyces roseoverticillatus TaxID=66429 RepID=UPI001F2FC236|nr:phosphomannomutase/phosphoglucomutase [Streptomyces roseoverticillatus]MCF3100997.1 phosphomannomutase/phosphoglucomutase [Streptomyces roseoverticillatus]